MGSTDRFAETFAIVTGAGSGIGRAIARRLLSEGASVAGIDLAEGGLVATAELAGPAGGAMSTHVCDVADPDQVARTLDEIRARTSAIHALVNVAGIGVLAHSTEQPPAEWSRILEVNLSGTFSMCRATLPDLLAVARADRQHGVGRRPDRPALQHGVLRVEGRRHRPRPRRSPSSTSIAASPSTRIAPAGIETPLTTDVPVPDGVDFAKFARLSSPMGTAQPEEVAGLVAFLLSPESRYMTGSIVTMDGGVSV